MKIAPYLVLALLSQTPAAFAASPELLPSQAVRTADLDLSTARGQTKLGHRVRVAVNAVCGEASVFDLAGQNHVARCRDETRASVQTQVQLAIAARQNRQVASAK